MIDNLSSKITLERIPERYYRPLDSIDQIRQSRKEKINTEIFESTDEAAASTAQHIAELINSKIAANQACVLGLAGGTSPVPVYKNLVELYKAKKVNFSNVHVFIIAEFCPLSENAEHSNTKVVCENLLDKVDFDKQNLYSPNSIKDKTEVFDFCRSYEDKMASLGGLDLILTSVGLIGNIAYNEPGSQASSLTRLMLLDAQSRKDLKHFYLSSADVPTSAVTVGVSTFFVGSRGYSFGLGRE